MIYGSYNNSYHSSSVVSENPQSDASFQVTEADSTATSVGNEGSNFVFTQYSTNSQLTYGDDFDQKPAAVEVRQCYV